MARTCKFDKCNPIQGLSIQDTSPHNPSGMSSVVNNSGLARFWYGAAIADFLTSDADDILGKLSRHAGDGHFSDQRDAWLAQIDLLKTKLTGLEGWVFFEFNIPRMGRRVDVILVLGSVIFAL